MPPQLRADLLEPNAAQAKAVRRTVAKKYARSEKAGLAKPLFDAPRFLRASLEEHLSMIYMGMQHSSSPEQKKEAERVLSRHPNVSFHVGFEEGVRGRPEADWNRMCRYALRSVKHLKSSLKAMSVAQKIIKSKSVANVLKSIDEAGDQSSSNGKRISERKRADGRSKGQYLKRWMGCLAKARKELGLPSNALVRSIRRYIKEPRNYKLPILHLLAPKRGERAPAHMLGLQV